MKKWRRRGGIGTPAAEAPGPELVQDEGLLAASGTYFGSGGLFIYWEESANGVDGWSEVQFDAIDADPMQLDWTLHTGPFFRCRIGFGGGVFSAWSNVVDTSP